MKYLPDTYPMAKVPDGGWTGRFSNPSWEVRHLLISFNAIFNSMLNKLESAWVNGNQGDLGDAVNEMFQLKSPAVELMKIPLPSTYDRFSLMNQLRCCLFRNTSLNCFCLFRKP